MSLLDVMLEKNSQHVVADGYTYVISKADLQCLDVVVCQRPVLRRTLIHDHRECPLHPGLRLTRIHVCQRPKTCSSAWTPAQA